MGAWHRPYKQTGAWQRARCSYSSARGAAKPFAAHPFRFSPQCSLHLFPVHGIIANRTYYKWRSDREAEGARLLSEYAPKGHLGFESPALRQYEFEEGSHLGPFFIIKNGGWGFEPSKRRHPFGRPLSVDLLFLRPTSQEPWLRSRSLPQVGGCRCGGPSDRASRAAIQWDSALRLPRRQPGP